MKKHLAQYSKSLVPIARVLRKQMTDAERKLWSLLRGHQVDVKFRRQVPFGCCVVDFYCAKAKLVIELDGSQHYTNKGTQSDIKRDDYMRKIGCEVIRYSNYEIFENEDGVMQDIFEHVKVRTGKSLDPL
jgi:very-short-patch-repair endonuclease